MKRLNKKTHTHNSRQSNKSKAEKYKLKLPVGDSIGKGSLCIFFLSTSLIKNTAWSFTVQKESSADCFLNFLLCEKLLWEKKHLHFHIY